MSWAPSRNSGRPSSHFALHHDLTNCLRIADLTEFTADGKRLFHEIKAKPHIEKKQLERAQAVVEAINSGGVLPGSTGDSRLVELKEPYVTNLNPLNDLLQLAKRNGSHGMKLPQGRAIVDHVACPWSRPAALRAGRT